MSKTIENKQWSLGTRDFLRGLIIAVITAVLTIAVQTLESGSLSFDWTAILTAGGVAAASYLLKNLVEPTKVITIHDPQE